MLLQGVVRKTPALTRFGWSKRIKRHVHPVKSIPSIGRKGFNMRTSAVLRLAKQRVARTRLEQREGKSLYICMAIESLNPEVTDLDKSTTKDFVMRQLDGRISLGSWLWKHYKIDSYEDHQLERMQFTRHAWLDYMIEQLEKEGR